MLAKIYILIKLFASKTDNLVIFKALWLRRYIPWEGRWDLEVLAGLAQI